MLVSKAGFITCVSSVDYAQFLRKTFYTGSSPSWKRRGFPSRGLIVPTIDSGLHLSSGGQSSGSENHSHLKGGLSLSSSSPLKEKEDNGCSSHSPIKPSIELEKSVVSVTKRNFGKGVFKHGAIHPIGEAFRPLNPFLCNQFWLGTVY